jgi:hypothetical protein
VGSIVLRIGFSLLLGVAAFACVPPAQTHVAEGQLYTAGEESFDAYFRAVHAMQVDEDGWAEAYKTTRRPLVTTLALADASSDLVLQASHEHAAGLVQTGGSLRVADGGHVVAGKGTKTDAPFFKAVEDTLRAEIERAKRLENEAAKADALSKMGHDLEPHVHVEYARAQPTRVHELRLELRASFDAIEQAREDARRYAREAGEFANELQKSLAFNAGKPKNGVATAPHAAWTTSATAPAAPAAAAAPATPKSDPKPQPKAEQSEEVFTP